MSFMKLFKTSYNGYCTADNEPRALNKVSFYIIYAIVVIGGAARGLLFPLLWGLCQAVGGSTVDLGYLAAIFGLGRLIATSPLGYISDRYQQRFPLVLSFIVLIFGTLLWANAYSLKSLGLLYVSQFLLGLGSGTVGVTRSFIVEQTPVKERTGMLAFVSALQYAGLTISSFLGSLLGQLGKQIDNTGSSYWTYALPSYFVFILALYCLIALLTLFKNASECCPTLPIINSLSSSSKAKGIESIELASTSNPLNNASSSDQVISSTAIPTVSPAVLTNGRATLYIIYFMIFLNVTSNGTMAVYETLVSKIGSQSYNMSNINIGIMITVSGIVGFLQLLSFKSFWCLYFSDLELILIGCGISILAQIVIISLISTTAIGNFVSSTVIMYAFGYPIAKTAVLGTFSKIQKKGVQGAIMGWFATAAAFSRIVFPLICSYLKHNGPFAVNLMVLVISYALALLLRDQISLLVDGTGAVDATTSRGGPSHWIATIGMGQYWYDIITGDKFQLTVLLSCFIFALCTLSIGSSDYDVDEWSLSSIFDVSDVD